jgi:hypothetical protein
MTKGCEMKQLLLLALAMFATAITLNAQQSQSCKNNPKVVRACFKIHGRVRVGNGIGMVIWRIGTERILGVGDADILIPDNLSNVIFKKGDIYGRDVFGDFEVCPFTKSKEGEMQMVCVESASHLVVKDDTH